MPYAMHRVFCATSGDLEEERLAFHKVMADVNQNEAMPRGILLVSISLPDTTFDKRPYQSVLAENVRSCRYYVQVLDDSWGPVERNFEREYVLATRCVADPSLPMQGVVVLFKEPLLPDHVDPRVVEFKQRLNAGNTQPHADFANIEEFMTKLHAQLSSWLQTIAL